MIAITQFARRGERGPFLWPVPFDDVVAPFPFAFRLLVNMPKPSGRLGMTLEIPFPLRTLLGTPRGSSVNSATTGELANLTPHQQKNIGEAWLKPSTDLIAQREDFAAGA